MTDFRKECLTESILFSSSFIGKKTVSDIKEIATVAFSETTKAQLIQILKAGEVEKLTSFNRPKDLFGEELIVVRFKDESQKICYALFYDSLATSGRPRELFLTE